MTRPAIEEIEDALHDHLGWCTECEEWTHDCCEPDADGYECPVCGNETCYGAIVVVEKGMI